VLEVHWERFGRPAARALRGLIAEAQNGDPLAPATVIVPRGSVGLATRRLLASGDLDPGRPGIAGISFPTARMLAADLAGSRVAEAGGAPLSTAALYAATRAVLGSTDAPLIGPVGDHPATVRSVVAAYRDLRGASPGALAALAHQSSRAGEVVEVVRTIRATLDGWYDDVDVAETAIDLIREDPVRTLGHLGTVILYLPLGLPRHHVRMVAAIADRVPVTVVAGTTGVDRVDESARRLIGELGGPAPPITASDGLGGGIPEGAHGGPLPGARPAGGPVTADAVVGVRSPREAGTTTVLSGPTADAEILTVVREVMARAGAGVPFERMAIVHGGVPPYDRAVREALVRAGIPHHGAEVRPLSATVAGRVLLGLFELADHDLARGEVAGWLSTGPVRFRGKPVPSAEWDVVSRDAGVNAGHVEWEERLAAFARAERHRAAEASREGDTNRAGSYARAANEADALATFVDELAARVAQRPGSWAGWVGWARAALAEYLGGSAARATWPSDEAAAFTAVEEILHDLVSLDGVDPSPAVGAFRSVLVAELESPAPQTTRFGRGILLGEVRDAVGIDLEAVFVVGMDDATFPPPNSEDALLPDREREAASGEIPVRAGRSVDGWRDFLAVSAGANERVLSFARGDAHRRTEARPSRWLLEAIAQLASAERRLFPADLGAIGEGEVVGYRALPSYTAAVAESGEVASPEDFDLRALLGWRTAGRRIDAHPVAVHDPVLALGYRASRARRGHRFGPFDGLAARPGIVPPSPVSGEVQSATGMEAYAACPRRYFFGHVLRVGLPPEPEAAFTITARDRGSLVHRVLERYVRAEIAGSADDPDGADVDGLDGADVDGLDGADVDGLDGSKERSIPETIDDRLERIANVAATVFEEFERAGLTGRPLLWSIERVMILRDLRGFVRNDMDWRAQSGARPVAAELAIGGPGSPFKINLPEGRRVRFRGVVDRVDRCADGSIVVIDYKTGRVPSGWKADADPIDRGRRLQLPVYALGVGAREGDAPVRADYWYVTTKEKFARRSVDMNSDLVARFSEAVTTIVDGIESGIFPARPGPVGRHGFTNCGICEFTSACPPDRDRRWERLRNDAAVRQYVALAEPAEATGRDDAESDR
jgi:RecB family exonuclease